MDQITEEPEMAATFVDAIADELAIELGRTKTTITDAAARVEHNGAYAKTFRMLLAAEASLEHAITALHAARLERQQEWSRNQKEALAFLEVRTASSGRRFIVKGHPGRTYRGLPDTGQIFQFELGVQRSIGSASGSSRVAKVEILIPAAAVSETRLPIALQTLHRAMLFGDVVEATDPLLSSGELEDLRKHLAEEIGPIARLEFDRRNPRILLVAFAGAWRTEDQEDRSDRALAIVRAHIGDRPIEPAFTAGGNVGLEIGGHRG
jgi:hypothetical protein